MIEIISTVLALSYSRTIPAHCWCRLQVFTEVCLLLERRRGTRAELAFLRDVGRGIFTVVDLTEADLDRISELVDAYSNLPLGTVDASVVAIAERLRVPTVATLDRRHFTVVKPRQIGAFTLLPDAPV